MCGFCEKTHLMYGDSKHPGGAEVCCNVENVDGGPAFTMTAYYVANPEHESGTVFRGWVPINNCPMCGRDLRKEGE